MRKVSTLRRMNLGPPNPSSPGLWKLSVAAQHAGLTPRQLASACTSGHIPVRLVTLGEKSRFVVIEDLNRWLASLNPVPAENLF